MVDFPVPRPPISALYWGLSSRSKGPKKALLLTLMLLITTAGSFGAACMIRDSCARHACRNASALGIAHFIHVVHFPSKR